MGDKNKPGAYTGYTKARKEANARYEANTVERVSLVVPKGRKAEIAAHAAARGESVNGFIGRAITETMDRDNGNPSEAADALSGSGATPIPDGTETPSEAAQSGGEGGITL